MAVARYAPLVLPLYVKLRASEQLYVSSPRLFISARIAEYGISSNPQPRINDTISEHLAQIDALIFSSFDFEF
jgi:hypothetical protein